MSEQLNSRQYETLERIVGIPSPFTQEDPVGDETELQDAIHHMLDDPSVRLTKQNIDADSKRYNIIAQKGAPLEDAKYVVMVYVHTDTIKKKSEWGDAIDYKLVRDGDVLRGIGAYDMKAGAAMLIDLLQTVDMPEGVTLVGAFCCGEERDSDGIQTLMEWPGIGKVNVVLSPEIGTNPNESDNPKDIIVGRPGNVKSNIIVTAQDSHAYKEEAANAFDAWVELYMSLRSELYSRINGEVCSHPDFGNEKMQPRDSETEKGGEFESIVAANRAKFAVRIVPPTKIDDIREFQQHVLDELKADGNWDDYGIDAQFTKLGTSYNPYMVRTDSAHVQSVAAAAEEFYGASRLSPGLAVADGAYGHEYMNRKRGMDKWSDFNQFSLADKRTPDQPVPEEYVPWLDIGPLGDGAHKKTERVNEASLVKLIEFYEFYLTDYLPRYLGSDTDTI